MSKLAAVHVQHVRIHESYSIELSGGITVITGSNGAGKTSLLESIYVALRGSSFRGSDADILMANKPWWRIVVAHEDGTRRTVSFDSSKQTKKKQFEVHDKKLYRLSPQHKYPVVLFEPDDLRLLQGSPARRRLFIDRFISQLDPIYNSTLSRYERALRQRNNILKRPSISSDDLFVWDVALSEYGAYIISQRTAFIEKINSQLQATYDAIARTHDTVSMHYSHTSIDSIQQKLLNDLHAHSERDKILGYTSIGPHRHDVIFKYNDQPALSVASRGEARSIVLALKFLEIEIITSITGLNPVVLLDDVFSELDTHRQSVLLNNQSTNQIIITATHIDPSAIHDAKQIIIV